MVLTFNLEYFWTVWPQLLEAVPFTLYFIVMSSVVSLLAGILVALIRIPRLPVLYQLTEVWMSFVRSMPFVLLLFLSYFLLPLPLQTLGVDTNAIPKEVYVYVAMIIHYGPIIAEVIRPAYEAVPRGQTEAAIAFGLSAWHRVTRILLPQALPIMLPGMVNQLIEIIKDTSLMYMIGLMDLMGRANLLIHLRMGEGKLECYIAVAIIYWLLISALELLAARLDERSQKFLRRRAA
ncbi:ABC transporter permease subunit [uncultured Phascolarctobacterium sp.]|uniref:amino acid ABC transporter permease n=1 Tax=uncultured Phascolarctobacterium sp. TaxID=512296 RepID=UPI0025F3B6AD|nr:ABC transporter permease subunit [uncultured Phascolarctobacterium sp.]